MIVATHACIHHKHLEEFPCPRIPCRLCFVESGPVRVQESGIRRSPSVAVDFERRAWPY